MTALAVSNLLNSNEENAATSCITLETRQQTVTARVGES